MKKIFALLAISGSIAACGDSAPKTETTADTATSTTVTAPAPEVTAAVKDSVMQLKDGKVMIVVGGTWSALAAPVTTSNGRVVSPDGSVSKGGKSRKLDEGMMIDKDGQISDKDGKAVDNTGWE